MASKNAFALRFTRYIVREMQEITAHGAVMANHSDKGRTFVKNSLGIGGDIGHGTRYIGFSGYQTVEYKGKGARYAVAYFWGMGKALGAWDALRGTTTNGVDTHAIAESYADAARQDLGDEIFTQWEDKGKHYASRFLSGEIG